MSHTTETSMTMNAGIGGTPDNEPAASAFPDRGTTTTRPPAEPTGEKHRLRGFLIVTGACALTAAIVAGVIFLTQPAAATPEKKQPSVETATVTKGDLTEQIRVQGTLAYSTPSDLGTELPGTITGLPPVGSTLTAGNELFRINNSPIFLMRGALPVWREFSPEMTPGKDVQQLEENLATLGFFGRTPDEKFTPETANAIKKWQKSHGMEQNGAIENGRIVFSPIDLRVQSAKAKIGDPNGPAIIAVTGVTKEIQSFIETSQQSMVAIGGTVAVSLPGGGQTNGTITAIGAPVEKEGSSGTSMKVPVTLTPDDPAATADFDNVSVSLVISEVKATDTLLVPVVALLAQPGGGYAVEVVKKSAGSKGKTSKVVPIKLGAFANGMVAVASGDVSVGDTIVVAK